MSCDERAAMTALACALIASTLINLCLLYRTCASQQEPADQPEMLGASLLTEESVVVFARRPPEDTSEVTAGSGRDSHQEI